VKRAPEMVRPPTTEEIRGAVMLSQAFLKAVHPEPTRTIRRTVEPPGRIDMRRRTAAKHQKQQHVPVTAKQYKRTVQEYAPTFRKKLAIMGDISGSMGGAQEPLGVARWMLTEAMSRVGGQTAAVLFGHNAHPIQKVGQKVKQVEVYGAYDGHENYAEAFSMLDGALDLIDGDGARLLVCITDGHFNLPEAVDYAELTMDMCRTAGVGVLWVNVSGYFARGDAYGHGSIVEAHNLTPVQFAQVIGKAVSEEFRKASRVAA